MKRKQFFSGILACTLFLSGCQIVIEDPSTSEQSQETGSVGNQDQSYGNDGGFGSNSGGSSSSDNRGSGASETTAPANVSLAEVLKKSREKLASLPGYEYRTVGDQSFTINLNGQQSTNTYQAELTLTLKNNPFAYIDRGTASDGDSELEIDTYHKNNTTYFIMGAGNYGKTGAPEDEIGLFHSPRPGIILKNIAAWTDGAPKSKLGGVLREQGDQYVIDIDIASTSAGRNFYLKEMQNYMEHQLQVWRSQDMGDLYWNQASIQGVQEVYIDKQNFEVKKMIHDITLTVPVERGETITVKQRLVSTLNGDYTGDIVVPEDLKQQAQDVQ
jgi:hypothetical protein